MRALDQDPWRAARCVECSSPLARDQRYCVDCGRRVKPLPTSVASAIAAASRPLETPPAIAAAAAAEHRGPWSPDQAPWQAAVAIMGLLAFGVVLGGAAGPQGPVALAAAPTVAASPASPAPVAGIAAAAEDDPAAEDDAVAADVAPAADTALATPAIDDAAAEDPGNASGDGDAPVSDAPDAATPAADGVPPAGHVFVIALSGHGYDSGFGPGSASPYLAQELPARGELLQNYYAVAPSELSNGVALISGQGPTPETAANCPSPTDLTPAAPGPDAQVLGAGCIYPAATRTIGDQLSLAGNSWKAYVEGQGDGTTGTPAACRRPVAGESDPATTPQPTDPYVTARNPFVYFHSVADAPTCATVETGLEQLTTDLASAATTPSLSYIVPSRCHDGTETPCSPGSPAGLAATDAFLRTVVPAIEASPAYKADGVIAITFDGAPQSGPSADLTGCCGTPVYPNMPAPTTPSAPGAATPAPPTAETPATTTPTTPATPAPAGVIPADEPGGGKVGLLLLSQYVEPGTTNTTNSYNHYSLLAGIEDIFDLDRLGYAAYPTLPAFDRVVWNAKAKGTAAP